MAAGILLVGLLASALGLSHGGLGAVAAQPAPAPSSPASAVDLKSPVGSWTTIDDESGQPKARVRITEAGGVLTGRIEKLLAPSRPNPTCDACDGERKGRPIEGMAFLTGLRPSEDGTVWEGGEILDPNNGKVYRARAKLADGGRKLEVRGFVGVALFGRTQTWVRN